MKRAEIPQNSGSDIFPNNLRKMDKTQESPQKTRTGKMLYSVKNIQCLAKSVMHICFL